MNKPLQSTAAQPLNEERTSQPRKPKRAGRDFGMRTGLPRGAQATRRAHWRQGPLRPMAAMRSGEFVCDMVDAEEAEERIQGEAASLGIVMQMVEFLMADLAKEKRVSMPRLEGVADLEDSAPEQFGEPGTELSARLQRVEAILRSLAEVLLVAV